MKKTFDCVAMKRRSAEKIYKQIAEITIAQEMAFWQQRTDALREKQRALRNRHRKSGRAVSHSGLATQSSVR